MKKFNILILVVIILSFSLTGCNNSTSEANLNNNEKITIAVSIIPQETFVKKIAGDLVNVVTMIPPGYSPANYQPTPKQMTMLSKAKIYFSIGVPTELANILPNLNDFNKEIKQVALDGSVGDVYPHRYFQSDNSEKQSSTGTKDPHIWLSPKRVIVMIKAIKDELIVIDPQNQFIYENNASEYIAQLQQVDNEISDTLKNYKNTSFLIYHPSLGYFSDDYGLNMVTVESEGKEATTNDLKYIVDFANKQDIRFIFYQQEFDSNQAETIANEIGGATIKIAPLSSDYIENLKNIVDEFNKVLK